MIEVGKSAYIKEISGAWPTEVVCMLNRPRTLSCLEEIIMPHVSVLMYVTLSIEMQNLKNHGC